MFFQNIDPKGFNFAKHEYELVLVKALCKFKQKEYKAFKGVITKQIRMSNNNND